MENCYSTVILILLYALVLSVRTSQARRQNDSNQIISGKCTAIQYGTFKVAFQFCDGKYWRVIQHGSRNAPKGSKTNPGKSCHDIKSDFKSAESGIYWIRIPGKASRKAFQVYCDMETHGGGWTLVYSYTFTNYKGMTSSDNAVTPIPNWPVSVTTVSISTSPPLSESTFGAVDYKFWKDIGKDVLIKSNINHWIICKENGGSVVNKKNGPMLCQNIKDIAHKCRGNAPFKITWNARGPYFSSSSLFYYFDGNTKDSWPTHDPCGTNQRNEVQGIAEPRGAIFLR